MLKRASPVLCCTSVALDEISDSTTAGSDERPSSSDRAVDVCYTCMNTCMHVCVCVCVFLCDLDEISDSTIAGRDERHSSSDRAVDVCIRA
jgi:hypothetical protein